MLKKIRQAKLGLGIEEDTNNPEAGAGGAGGGAPTDPIEPTGGAENTSAVEPEVAAADAAVDEVADAGEQVIDDGEVVEELDDAKAALEEIYEDMRVSLENGGMSTDTARIANRYVNRTLKRVKMVNPMPSCEAFGGFGDRYVSTSVAMEGIGDKIKEIWEKIKTWFANMWKNIRIYWQKVWDAAPKLKARAEALRKKADDLGGKTAQDKQFDVGADIVKKLYGENGKLADVAGLTTAMSSVTTLTTVLFGDYYSQALKFAEHYSDKLAAVSEPTAANLNAIALGSGELDSPVSVALSKVGSLAAASEPAKAKFAGASEVHATGTLFAGQVVAFAKYNTTAAVVADAQANANQGGQGNPEPANGVGSNDETGGGDTKVADNFKNFALNTVKLMTLAEKTPEVSEGTYNTMALGEVQKLCDEVIKLCDSIASYRKDWDKAEKVQSKVLRAGDNFSRAAGKSSEKGGDDVSAANAAIALTKKAGEWIAQPNQSFSRYAMESAKAVLMLCDKSLAKYS